MLKNSEIESPTVRLVQIRALLKKTVGNLSLNQSIDDQIMNGPLPEEGSGLSNSLSKAPTPLLYAKDDKKARFLHMTRVLSERHALNSSTEPLYIPRLFFRLPLENGLIPTTCHQIIATGSRLPGETHGCRKRTAMKFLILF
ncbi:hypothetical protein [Mycoavidus sp. SF9855]|uniref:hypothetical protein n=1 Tax=Mycoavidus sp. SF9855 TaxID=2968475 RepID=UPI00211BC881|nr:hypothetical protein [Mycoavidus sp. SF9855]UUM21176.1 hypothetical protein NQD60_06920 [Mycoavidus sp. SF9855]